MNILGIDPSQRHTGLALKKGGSLVFYEIKTKQPDLLSSVLQLKTDLYKFIDQNAPGDEELFISMEKQVASGQSSQLLFYVQMAIFEVLKAVRVERMVNPLPIQLKAYMRKAEGVNTLSKTDIVESFRERYGKKWGVGRISSHCVEAFYLIRMAEEVLAGTWTYALTKREVALTPWPIMGGVPNGKQVTRYCLIKERDREAL